MNVWNLRDACQVAGAEKSNRAIGSYWECIGHVMRIASCDAVDWFDSCGAYSEHERHARSCEAEIERFALVRGLVAFSLALGQGQGINRYYPARTQAGLAGCVMMGEVDAMDAAPALVLQAMAMHQATAAACGMTALPLSVHMARLVLRARDCDAPVVATLCVQGGCVRELATGRY